MYVCMYACDTKSVCDYICVKAWTGIAEREKVKEAEEEEEEEAGSVRSRMDYEGRGGTWKSSSGGKYISPLSDRHPPPSLSVHAVK